MKTFRFADFMDADTAADFDAGAAAFFQKQSNDFARAEVAEKLAEFFLVPADAVIEVLASGFAWSEGPVWVASDKGGLPTGCLLFSDIPHNRIHRWQPGQGLDIFLEPAGFTGPAEYGRERGSNGLTLDRQGRLICCEHGDRRISRLEPGGGKKTLADSWQGKRLNSPNDATVHSSGAIYFTDWQNPIIGHMQHNLRDPSRDRIHGRSRADACRESRLAGRPL